MCKEEKGESYLYLYGENPQAVGQTHLENKNNKGQIIYTEERSISTLYTSNWKLFISSCFKRGEIKFLLKC